jgi:hypothetical protein
MWTVPPIGGRVEFDLCIYLFNMAAYEHCVRLSRGDTATFHSARDVGSDVDYRGNTSGIRKVSQQIK